MNKGYLVLALDIRGHFVSAKVYANYNKALEYKAYLNNNSSKPVGDEMSYIDDVEIFEIEIDNS